LTTDTDLVNKYSTITYY